MIEIMITRKYRLEPTLILQSVNDVTNCKRNQKEKHFFLVFIKYAQLIQPTLNPGIKIIHGIRDQDDAAKWVLLHGQITTIVSTFSSRHGLCPNPVNTHAVLVGDRNDVKEINIS